jgi:hypothetical protein
MYVDEMRIIYSELRTENFPNPRKKCAKAQCHVLRGLRVYLIVTMLKHKNTGSLSIRVYCYVLRQLPTCHPPTRGPGWLSRYSDSLRAGRSSDRMPVGASFPHPSRPVPGPTPSSTMGTGSFSGTKRPKRGVDHPPPI